MCWVDWNWAGELHRMSQKDWENWLGGIQLARLDLVFLFLFFSFFFFSFYLCSFPSLSHLEQT